MRSLLAAFVVVVALSAGTAASADEVGECVEAGLAERGYDPGAPDGAIDESAVAAAEAFVAAGDFTMPPLTSETAGQWCAVLAGWDDRDAGPTLMLRAPVDYGAIADLANPDPSALPRGIHFTPSVPSKLRSLIIEDLAWLAGLGRVEHAGNLAALMRLPEPLTGTQMVNWLVGYVMAIGTPADGCVDSWLKAEPVIVLGSCDDFAEGIAPAAGVSLHAVPVAASTAVVRHVGGGMRVVAPDSTAIFAPVVYLNPDRDFWQGPARAVTDGARLSRLSILFHEASHIAFNELHWPCRGEAPVEVLVYSGEELEHTHCDEDPLTSAYLLGGLVEATLALNCDCDFLTRSQAMEGALYAILGTTIPLRVPDVTPRSPDLAAYGLAGVTYQFAMPAAFFDIAEIQLEEFLAYEGCPCGTAVDTLPGRLETMRRVAQSQAVAGNLLAEWRLEPVAPGGEQAAPVSSWGEVWLARARRAEAEGYNVPLRWVVDCAAFADSSAGCGAL